VGVRGRQDVEVISAERLAATADLPAPLMAVDLDAFDANAAELLRRAHGRPVRLATKSVRVPALVERALSAGFSGLMAYSVREALWWAGRGADDVLLGYPSVDVGALTALSRDVAARGVVTVMVDEVAHLDLVERVTREAGAPEPVRVCLDVDSSLRVGPRWVGSRRVHLGVRRSPLREPAEVAALAQEARRRGIPVRGLMFYEAQVAGLPDASAAVRAVKRASLAELRVRRGAVVAAVEEAVGHPLTLVNGGGTGSLARTAADPAVTELTSGSGLLAPTLFDGYRLAPGERRLRPAAFFGLDVVRRPAPGLVTVFSGGFLASGPVGPSRTPTPVLPRGLRLTSAEGAGEVQTPLRGRAADRLAVGDRVWFRHAKAGEVMERFADAVLLAADGGREVVPTYRGAGLSFG
jgi:D-serine deaminase-like pyridoxal phosphate-dependent protein